jgi:thymidylate kinase
MKLIIEGGDHVGKSTAAKGLSVAHSVPVIHASKKGDDYDHVYDRMADLQIKPAIYDRFHLSAFVYGRLLGLHPQNLTDFNFHRLVQWLKAQEVWTVIMFASDHADLEQRMLDAMDKDEMFDIGIRLAANQHYENLALHGYRGQLVCDVAWDISKLGFPQIPEMRSWA